MIYTYEEIMREHEYSSANEMGGYLLHGGLDENGTYISPRTKIRWEAINGWADNLQKQRPQNDLHLLYGFGYRGKVGIQNKQPLRKLQEHHLCKKKQFL